MKRSGLILFVAATLVTLGAVEQRTFPTAKLTVRVIDEAGEPVKGALVKMRFHEPLPNPEHWGTGKGDKIVSAPTDDFGLCTLSDHSYAELAGAVLKDGFYPGSWIPYKFQNPVGGKWQPWDATAEVTLKKIVNPTPMFARRTEVEMPTADAAIGFDLMEADWVSPNGNGKSPDLVFRLTKRVASFHDFRADLEVSFPNRGDGIQAMLESRSGRSELRSSHSAPEAGYSPSVSLLQGNSKQGGEYGTSNNPRDYFFRVRTVIDAKGQVVSALYGKIYGSIEYFPVSYKAAKLRFTYYLNATPNDRNLEFDPKRNLFTNLKDEERVTAP